VPGLSWLTDPPDEQVAGDQLVPRVVVPGFGASERLVVSPGHEAQGIFEMPAGQAGDPLTPYYGAGHEIWVPGGVSPLLPGSTKWRLELTP
jgi:penicillin G amidase